MKPPRPISTPCFSRVVAQTGLRVTSSPSARQLPKRACMSAPATSSVHNILCFLSHWSHSHASPTVRLKSQLEASAAMLSQGIDRPWRLETARVTPWEHNHFATACWRQCILTSSKYWTSGTVPCHNDAPLLRKSTLPAQAPNLKLG